MVGYRIGKIEEEKIKVLVERGEFMSVSDLVRSAVRKLLAGYRST